LLNTGQIAAPVGTPVCFGRIVESGTLSRIVVVGAAVEETVSNDLIDDVALKIRCPRAQRSKNGLEEKGDADKRP
jgi:hypothetical protein